MFCIVTKISFIPSPKSYLSILAHFWASVVKPQLVSKCFIFKTNSLAMKCIYLTGCELQSRLTALTEDKDYHEFKYIKFAYRDIENIYKLTTAVSC